jgi:glutathione S-transferase
MKLIGMLDSPFVRRVAVALEFLHVPFEHEAVSVFSTFAKFQSINPVVKAPTLFCDDGEVLMDSSLILQYVEAVKTAGRTLWPQEAAELQHDMRAVSLALAAAEKSAQFLYESNLRPATAQYQPWLQRVQGQLLAAYAALEREVSKRPAAFGNPTHASIIATIAWGFTQAELANMVPARDYPALSALAARMEAMPEFIKYPPIGPGVPTVAK